MAWCHSRRRAVASHPSAWRIGSRKLEGHQAGSGWAVVACDDPGRSLQADRDRPVANALASQGDEFPLVGAGLFAVNVHDCERMRVTLVLLIPHLRNHGQIEKGQELGPGAMPDAALAVTGHDVCSPSVGMGQASKSALFMLFKRGHAWEYLLT